jgi:transposase
MIRRRAFLAYAVGQKKAICGQCGGTCRGWCDRRQRQARDLPNGTMRLYLRFETRRVQCLRCNAVKRERLDFLADNPFYAKRFAYYVGQRCRASCIKELAEELSRAIRPLVRGMSGRLSATCCPSRRFGFQSASLIHALWCKECICI